MCPGGPTKLPDDDSTSRPAWIATRSSGAVQVRFLGRAGPRHPDQLDLGLDPAPEAVSWLRQVHSARVLQASPGEAGEADALVTHDTEIALTIKTADCVPVLLATTDRIAAAHAGWRGLVSGVIGATLSRLGELPDATEAWIGPAIGPCCYEVGDEVAAQLAAASTWDIVSTRPGRKAHVDLHAAAIHQLSAHGVKRIHRVDLCTRCHQDILWSYRGEGDKAGRNWAMIWRQRPPEA